MRILKLTDSMKDCEIEIKIRMKDSFKILPMEFQSAIHEALNLIHFAIEEKKTEQITLLNYQQDGK